MGNRGFHCHGSQHFLACYSSCSADSWGIGGVFGRCSARTTLSHRCLSRVPRPGTSTSPRSRRAWSGECNSFIFSAFRRVFTVLIPCFPSAFRSLTGLYTVAIVGRTSSQPSRPIPRPEGRTSPRQRLSTPVSVQTCLCFSAFPRLLPFAQLAATIAVPLYRRHQNLPRPPPPPPPPPSFPVTPSGGGKCTAMNHTDMSCGEPSLRLPAHLTATLPLASAAAGFPRRESAAAGQRLVEGHLVSGQQFLWCVH